MTTRTKARTTPPVAPGFIDIGTTAPVARQGRTFQVLGVSNVYEGAMLYKLRNAEGDVVAHGLIQARSGSGTPGFFRETITAPSDAPAGNYRLSVYTRSPNDGAVDERDTTSVQIAPWKGESPYADTMVDIATPRPTQGVSRRFEVMGVSNVFRAETEYQVTDASGKTVKRGHFTASSGTGDPGFFRAKIQLPSSAKAGAYTLKVFARSPGDDGGITHIDTAKLRVR